MSVMADEHLAEVPRVDREFSMKRRLGATGVIRFVDAMGFGGMLRIFRFRGSALARRIITFNVIALCILLMGMLYLNQFKGGLGAGKTKQPVDRQQLVYTDCTIPAGR